MRHGVSRCGRDSRGGHARRRLPVVALVALAAPFLIALPSSAATTATGSLTIVIHGQGRVVSDPAGTIDCPGRCSFSFSSTTSLKLMATAATGYTLSGWSGFCGSTQTSCTLTLGLFTYFLDVYFRPSATLQVWPAGDGTVTMTPPGFDWRGDPAEPCTVENAFDGTGCEIYYLPGATVSAAASASGGSTFLGWSTPRCPGTGACTVSLSRETTSLVARFTPLLVRVIKAGNGTGRVTSEPAGISCPPTCSAPFPAGSQVTLVAEPAASSPFLSWKFGCKQDAVNPRRCTLTATNRPNWVGVALGEDDEIGVPTTLAVLFDVVRDGEGDVVGRQLDCGGTCERRYTFGTEEELTAKPAAGWRFTTWQGICAKEATCRFQVGPITTIGAIFTENLAPQLLGVQAGKSGGQRRITVRLSVQHAATVRLQLKREGAKKLLADRRYPLVAGANRIVLPLPKQARAGRHRLRIAVSDTTGGGKTYSRVVKVGK
jgi:Divergent InlB B-repeat domain